MLTSHEGQSNRRVAIALSKTSVERKVWQEVQKLDLSKLEAFRGD